VIVGSAARRRSTGAVARSTRLAGSRRVSRSCGRVRCRHLRFSTPRGCSGRRRGPARLPSRSLTDRAFGCWPVELLERTGVRCSWTFPERERPAVLQGASQRSGATLRPGFASLPRRSASPRRSTQRQQSSRRGEARRDEPTGRSSVRCCRLRHVLGRPSAVVAGQVAPASRARFREKPEVVALLSLARSGSDARVRAAELATKAGGLVGARFRAKCDQGGSGP